MRTAALFLAVAAMAACTTAEPVTSLAGTEALVVHVGDGDSIIVEAAGGEQRVRLIGINAPELDDCYGTESHEYLTALLEGSIVELVADEEGEDQYGRLLRYVYLDDQLVNASLVRNGYALARSYAPNLRMQDVLEDAQESAQAAARGLWSDCATESAVRIESVNEDAPGPDDENLNGEWVALVNEGGVPVDLAGWSIRDAESINRYSFADVVLGAGDELRLFTGCGTDGNGEFYWCARGPVWNNSGDVAFLLDPAGKIADRYEY